VNIKNLAFIRGNRIYLSMHAHIEGIDRAIPCIHRKILVDDHAHAESMLSKKWKTLRENPRGVIRKYINVAKLHLFITNPEIPIFGEDYSKHWKADFKGKVVLDLGADYGSTAFYFLQKGAREVIAVEGDRILALNLAKNAKGRRITPIWG
jgi:predicted methyltransferase